MQLRSAKTKDSGIVVTTLDILTPRTPSWGGAMRAMRSKVSIFQSNTIVNNMDLPPIPYSQTCPFCLTTTLGVPILSYDFIKLFNLFISKKWHHLQGKHQDSQLACLLEDSRQCRFRPWHTCPLRNTKKGSSEHFLFHRKTITNLKVAVNLLHLASLNCFEHFSKRFQLL